jgi:hypothetical protein
MEKIRGERLSRRADRLARTDEARTRKVPDEDYLRDIAKKTENVSVQDADAADEPRVRPEKVLRVSKSFEYVESGLVDPKNYYRVVLTGTNDDGTPVERIVMIPHGMLDLRDSDLADPTPKNDEIMEAIRRVDAGEIPSAEPEPKVDPLPKAVVPARDDASPAPEHFQDIGSIHTAAATEKKTTKPGRFIPVWAWPFLAPFAVAAGMAWLQVKYLKAQWWASGKAVGEKGGGGHEKKEKKEKKDDHDHGGGGGHGHH